MSKCIVSGLFSFIIFLSDAIYILFLYIQPFYIVLLIKYSKGYFINISIVVSFIFGVFVILINRFFTIKN